MIPNQSGAAGAGIAVTPLTAFGPFAAAAEYTIDAAQRSILFWDVMRQRGNQYREHMAQDAPHVLHYKGEVVIDGRTLERPVNYILARVLPPDGIVFDPARRPFVVIDPRAGHGPGIGGFKSDSEIGVAFEAGHPCYFIGFLPEPMPGQTIEDIIQAETVFLERVIALHPEADGKPCVIGNCQAGWALMMLAATRPELFGPLIIAGTPLSYWAGVRGQYPMRYSGGLLGGSWLTALTSDLGHGKFDGAWLVQNFENQNPANTLWTKQYNLYSKIDTETPRYLGFERWWGGHVNLNAEEIQFIVDELFIGNKLAAGMIRSSDGTTIDLRNVRSPMVVFCSKGDNVTPPQQALGWILDLYEDVDEIRQHGQTIVYTIHDTVGHLGIFVSSGVARKEHGEFSSNIDLIELLPPGLYEAVFEAKTDELTGSQFAKGAWVMRCETRTLDDIRALGGNDADDERRFATAARVSEINLALYRTFAQPLVRAMSLPAVADMMQHLHPARLQYEMFSDQNPWMAPIKNLADKVREDRRSVAADNSFLEFERTVSDQIVTALDSWRELVETAAEQTFLATYGSPLLQAAVGIEPGDQNPKRKAGKSPLHRELVRHRVADLRARIGIGGPREGAIRALLYAGMGRASVDERGFEAVRVIRATQDSVRRPALSDFKALVREQFFMLLLDVQASIATLPDLLPEVDDRRKVLAAVRNVLSASGEIEGEVEDRLQKLALVLGLDAKSVAAPRAAVSSVKRRRKSPRDEIGSSAVPQAVTARPRA